MDRSRIDKYELNSDCSFSIAPGWGGNMLSWVSDGVEMMYCPKELPAEATKITGGGNPLLFPSVGRTWDRSSGQAVQGDYKIHGEDITYFMPSHGILFFCEFVKVDEQRGEDSISVTYEARVPEEVREENYPFNLSFSQKYILTPTSVEFDTVIRNHGSTPAPAAFGHHPYLRVSSPQREGVEVRLPVKKHPLLTPDTVLFTGEAEDTDGIMKLQPHVYYDHAFSEPTGQRMSMIDPKAGHTIHVDYDEQFELFFVYSPDGSEFVCIEPWTRGLGAFEKLREPGWESGKDIPVLQPGEVKKLKAAISVEKLA